MSASLPALLALLLVCASGLPLLAALGTRAASGPALLGLAFGCGTVWLALGAFALSSAGGLSSAPALLLWLFAPALLLAHSRTRAGLVDGLSRARSGWAAFAPIVVFALLLFWLAAARPVWNIDAEKRWVLHGQWLAQDGTLFPARVADATWTTTCPHYPPLVSALVGFALELGADLDFGLRPLFPFFLLAALGALQPRAEQALGRLGGALALLALALTPALSFLDSDQRALGLGADAALADVPLACFVALLALGVLDRLQGRGQGHAALVAGALGCVLVKQEGLVSLLAIAGSALVCVPVLHAPGARRPIVRPLVLALAGACGVAALWRLATSHLPVESGIEYLSAAQLGALSERLERLPAILERMGAEFVAPRPWGGLWFATAACAALVLLRAPRRGLRASLPGLLVLAWIAAGIALALGAFLTTGWKDGSFQQLMEVSLARLLVHHAPLTLLLFTSAFGREEREHG